MLTYRSLKADAFHLPRSLSGQFRTGLWLWSQQLALVASLPLTPLSFHPPLERESENLFERGRLVDLLLYDRYELPAPPVHACVALGRSPDLEQMFSPGEILDGGAVLGELCVNGRKLLASSVDLEVCAFTFAGSCTPAHDALERLERCIRFLPGKVQTILDVESTAGVLEMRLGILVRTSSTTQRVGQIFRSDQSIVEIHDQYSLN